VNPDQLFVNVSAMGDASNADRAAWVVDNIDDTENPGADAPDIFVAAEFFTTGRSWIRTEAFDFRHKSRDEVVAEPVQLLASSRLNLDCILIHASVHA